MNREHVYSDESKYRCFVYEKSGKGDNKTVKMAQSLSASCDGLWSPLEGYRTFDMAKGRPNKSCNEATKRKLCLFDLTKANYTIHTLYLNNDL